MNIFDLVAKFFATIGAGPKPAPAPAPSPAPTPPPPAPSPISPQPDPAPAPISPQPDPVKPTMLILPGIKSVGSLYDAHGLLDRPSAIEYARRKCYVGKVLDVSGEAYENSPQVRSAIAAIRNDGAIQAIYGFSGGGYNAKHVIDALSPVECKRIRLLVVLGAPGNPASAYKGPWELVYRTDPPSGHMDGPRVLLSQTPDSGLKNTPDAQQDLANPLIGKPFRYLIGAGENPPSKSGEITHAGYDCKVPPKYGPKCCYGNLFFEKFSDDATTDAQRAYYGPYLHSSDTAQSYGEGQIDPRGPGWNCNLHDQFVRRKGQGFEYIELDNPDAYKIEDVIGAIDLAEQYGLKVIAKNPGLFDDAADQLRYVKHRNVFGIIVEKGAGDPAEMDALRRRAGKPDLPVFFVFFDKRGTGRRGRQAATRAVKLIPPFQNMTATYSPDGEYTSADDVR